MWLGNDLCTPNLDSVSASPFVSDPSLADWGENNRNAGELPAETANTNDDIRVSYSPLDMELTLKGHKRFKHAKDVPPDAVIQFLKPLEVQFLVLHVITDGKKVQIRDSYVRSHTISHTGRARRYETGEGESVSSIRTSIIKTASLPHLQNGTTIYSVTDFKSFFNLKWISCIGMCVCFLSTS